MKIKTKIYLSSSLVSGICLVVLVVIGYLLKEVESKRMPMMASERLYRDVTELSLLAHEYLLYGEKRIEEQWRDKFQLTESDFLLAGNTGISENEMIVQSLVNLKELFEMLVRNKRNVSESPGKEVYERQLKHIVSRIITEIRLLTGKTSQVSLSQHERLSKYQHNAILVMALLIILMIIIVAVYSYSLFRSMSRPLEEILDGIDIISKGDLEHSVELHSNDEFSIVAEAFNGMTENVIAILEAREKLSKEIEVRIEVEERLAEMASVDELTKINNRRRCLEMLEHEFEKVKRYGGELALFMIDVDNFKDINDSFGHDVGDAVLVDLCNIIGNSIRHSDSLYRFGGDEFVVILPETNVNTAHALASRVLEAMENNFVKAGDRAFKYHVSIGVAEYCTDIKEKEVLLKHADQALYKAKEAGRNRAAFYIPEEPTNIDVRVDL